MRWLFRIHRYAPINGGTLGRTPEPASVRRVLSRLAGERARLDGAAHRPRRGRYLLPGLRRARVRWRLTWPPAVCAAGLEHRSPYVLRHTYATFGIAAGVSLFELARFMGTSVDKIDKTYGHLLPDALDRMRQALDSFVSGSEVANEEVGR